MALWPWVRSSTYFNSRLGGQNSLCKQQKSRVWHYLLNQQAPILKVSFTPARTITFWKGESFHILKAVTPVPTRVADSASIDPSLLESGISISATLCTRVKKWPYIHTARREQHKHARTDIHTRDKHIFTSKGIPREGCCAHSVYCSPQLLISCFPCVMRGHPTWPAHKNCSRTLSLKPVCALLTSASLLNRTLALLGTVSLTRLLILPVFLHYLLFVSFILISSPPPSFFSPLSLSLT